MKTKIKPSRFFKDKKLAKGINLTQEELKIFDELEWEVLCHNGLRQINGGYSQVTIYDAEYEPDGKNGELCYLICEVECGEQDCGDGHSNCDKWQAKYNRETKKFEDT